MIQLNHNNIPNHRLRKRLTTLLEIIGKPCSTIDHYRIVCNSKIWCRKEVNQ
jgi:hypothetical protein